MRISYNDGSEGKPFPVFCLPLIKEPQEDGFFEVNAQIVSLRHMLADLITEISIIRNIEIQRRENSAEQENFAYSQVHHFINVFLKMLKKEIDPSQLKNQGRLFDFLWNKLNLQENQKNKLKLNLFQSTGLTPAIIGAYRAVTDCLIEFRGDLIVIPKIYQPKKELEEKFLSISAFEDKEKRDIVSKMYLTAKKWY